MSRRAPSPARGDPMAPLILSPRQRLELEYFVSHTPVARERCRAQALLWLDDGDLSVSVRMGTTLSGQWAPAHRLRREPFARAERGVGHLLGVPTTDAMWSGKGLAGGTDYAVDRAVRSGRPGRPRGRGGRDGRGRSAR